MGWGLIASKDTTGLVGLQATQSVVIGLYYIDIA
jgi:hypothetical protein